MPDESAGAGGFDSRTDAWAAWQSAPWGRLRYSVVQATIARSLAGLSGTLRVIDVGGGDGFDSLPLARAGHDVTILDFSRPLLDAAMNAARDAGLSDRASAVHADIDDLAGLELSGQPVAGSFDVVLCHNVLHYRTDVAATVATLVSLVRPSGVISLMAPNPAMDVLSAAVRRHDLSAALDVLDAESVHSETFDHPMRRLESSTVELALAAAGCVVEHRFGIRCVMDLIANDPLKREPDFFRQLEALELLLCEREPYWRTARFWQLTGHRV